MGHKPSLQDLKDVHPTIYHSLQKLLTQDGVAQLGLVFQVTLGPPALVWLVCQVNFGQLAVSGSVGQVTDVLLQCTRLLKPAQPCQLACTALWSAVVVHYIPFTTGFSDLDAYLHLTCTQCYKSRLWVSRVRV